MITTLQSWTWHDFDHFCLTLIVSASLGHFRTLKTLFTTYIFWILQANLILLRTHRPPCLQEMLCLKSSCLVEGSSCAGDSSVKHPLELPSPQRTGAWLWMGEESCHMPMHEQFLTRTQKHPKIQYAGFCAIWRNCDLAFSPAVSH